MLNLHSELQRIWRFDRHAMRLCPIEKVFAGHVPDKYVDAEGVERELNAPYVCAWTPDDDSPGGTSMAIMREIQLQISAFGSSRYEAEVLRNYAAYLFEDQNLTLGGQTETFQDISIGQGGELPPVDGVYEFFQRFTVETSISRPRRKRV